MLLDTRKRSTSSDRSMIFKNSQTSKLLWSDWVEAPFLSYLDLIDFEYKKKSFKSIPWFHVPFNQSEIHKYCLRSIYVIYKPIVINNITQCDRDNLPTLIRKFLYVYKLFNITHDFDESSYLYYYIAYSLLDKGCENPSVLLSLWKTLCVTNRTRVAVFSGVIGKHRKQKAAKLLKYVVKAAHSIRFDFWGAWTDGHDLSDFSFCPVTAALLTGCFEQMTILLEHGFEQNSQRLCTYDNHFMIRVDCIYAWLREPLVEKISGRRRTIIEVLLFLFNVARCRSVMKRVTMAKCFYLLWSITPTPFVTLQELQNEIYLRFCQPPIYSTIIFPSTENQFMELCDYYAIVFSYESINILQPRSLMHLSKCAIRSHLQKAWNLPFGIKALKLPKNLKSYLQVETDL